MQSLDMMNILFYVTINPSFTLNTISKFTCLNNQTETNFSLFYLLLFVAPSKNKILFK